MATFQYLDEGNSEAQDRLATSFLFAQTSPGLATTGVLSGLAVTQTTTASGSVLVAAGAAPVQASVGTGVALLVNDTQATLDVFTANPMGGLPRNDIVAFDSVTKALIAIIGTPNATPDDPTVPATACALARLRHAASATTIPAAKIDSLIVVTSLAGAVNPPGSPTPTGPVVTFDSNDTASVSSGTIILPAMTLPAVGCATRVFVQASGSAGFASSAQNNAIRIVGSRTVIQSTETPVHADVAQWATVARSGYMDIPANTSATIWLIAVNSAANAFYKTAMTLTRVNV